MKQVAWAAFIFLLSALGLCAFGDSQAVEVGRAMISGLLVMGTVLILFWLAGGLG